MRLEASLADEQKGVSENSFLRGLRPKVVTLAFFSEELPAVLISGRVSSCLFKETDASVVLVRLQCSDGAQGFSHSFNENVTVVDWAPADSILRGQFHGCNLVRAAEGVHLLTFDLRTAGSVGTDISSLLNQLRRHFDYILVECPYESYVRPYLTEILKNSDVSYLFLGPSQEEVERLDALTRAARESLPTNSRLKPVMVIGAAPRDAQFDSLLKRAPLPIERFIHGSPGMLARSSSNGLFDQNRSFETDTRRLAREIGDRLVGLVLSSGAAKGFAHIGVIQVLEENGIEIDVVVGASIGAYIGALWSYGHDGAELERLARELEGRWGFWRLLDPVFPPRQGFLRGRALRKRLMKSIGEARFADLLKPLRVVAGNLGSLDRTTFASGEVAAAVHASMAVPGICVPVRIEGESYIDGGIVDPVPVNVLRDMGVTRIIAVNVIPTPERMRLGFEAERARARQKDTRWRKLVRHVLPINKQLNYFARGNLFEILARSIHGAQVRLADASCQLADVVLRPDICDDRWLDCRNPRRFIALGRLVAQAQLEEIKALAHQSQLKDEREFARKTMASVA
jgi:NTE family protein